MPMGLQPIRKAGQRVLEPGGMQLKKLGIVHPLLQVRLVLFRQLCMKSIFRLLTQQSMDAPQKHAPPPYQPRRAGERRAASY